MSLPKSINAYSDVRAVLDAAVTAGGGTYTLQSANQAVRWRQRAYMLRKLIWEDGKESPWDTYEFVLVGCSVVIRPKQFHELRDANGLLLAPATTDEEDEAIRQEVENLKKKLDLET